MSTRALLYKAKLMTQTEGTICAQEAMSYSRFQMMVAVSKVCFILVAQIG